MSCAHDAFLFHLSERPWTTPDMARRLAEHHLADKENGEKTQSSPSLRESSPDIAQITLNEQKNM